MIKLLGKPGPKSALSVEKPNQTKDERRARREARREKQRFANIKRAAKMDAARLAWRAHPAPISKASTSQQYYVGCSGWFYWHWRDLFYPAGLPTGKWFECYASHFNTVELNAPFYSWPTVATVHTWLRQAGRRKFNYTVKVSELITHTKRFRGTKTLVRAFGHIADLLGRRMGCFLFQLPPSFHYTPFRLRNILSQLDPARRNVVEFRHRSWWNERVYAAFRSSGTIFCSCSGPGLPDELVKTGEDIYIRFHGVKQWYRHDYTSEELAMWAQRICASGAKSVYAYFNNDRDGYALRNAQTLRQMLLKRRQGKDRSTG